MTGTYKVDDTFRCIIPYSSPKSVRIHIRDIVTKVSNVFVLYSFYDYHGKGWRESLCTKQELDVYIDLHKAALKNTKKHGF